MENTTAKISAGSDERFSVFSIAGRKFGFRVFHVREVIQLTHVTRLPNAPHFLEGIINFRGKIVSVLDLATLFGSEAEAGIEYTGMVVIENNSGIISVLFEQVHDFIQIQDDKLDHPAEGIPDSIKSYLLGIYKEINLLNDETLVRRVNTFKF